jgi:hypothetical protein
MHCQAMSSIVYADSKNRLCHKEFRDLWQHRLVR